MSSLGIVPSQNNVLPRSHSKKIQPGIVRYTVHRVAVPICADPDDGLLKDSARHQR